MFGAMLKPALSALAAFALGILPLGCTAHSHLLRAAPKERCDHDHHGAGHLEDGTLRVVTYNIRAGKSSSLGAIYETLRSLNADVISLQEVEIRGERGKRPIDQAQWLADQLGMEVAFAAARKAGGDGHFGVAVLSRLPILDSTRVPLAARFSWEPRVALDVKLCTGAPRPLRVIAVHSDVFGWSSKANATTLASLAKSSLGEGVLIAGDLNTTPQGAAIRPLKRAGLADIIAEHAEGVTFPGFPTARLDYLLVDGPLREAVKKVRIGRSRASDHFPVLAEFDLGRLLGGALLQNAD